jgi:hypothetical protein
VGSMKCEPGSKSLILQRVVVAFANDGSISVAVSYRHGQEPQPTPDSKKRTVRATGLARRGLKVALEGLDKGAVVPTGFRTNLVEVTDCLIVERS